MSANPNNSSKISESNIPETPFFKFFIHGRNNRKHASYFRFWILLTGICNIVFCSMPPLSGIKIQKKSLVNSSMPENLVRARKGFERDISKSWQKQDEAKNDQIDESSQVGSRQASDGNIRSPRHSIIMKSSISHDVDRQIYGQDTEIPQHYHTVSNQHALESPMSNIKAGRPQLTPDIPTFPLVSPHSPPLSNLAVSSAAVDASPASAAHTGEAPAGLDLLLAACVAYSPREFNANAHAILRITARAVALALDADPSHAVASREDGLGLGADDGGENRMDIVDAAAINYAPSSSWAGSGRGSWPAQGLRTARDSDSDSDSILSPNAEKGPALALDPLTRVGEPGPGTVALRIIVRTPSLPVLPAVLGGIPEPRNWIEARARANRLLAEWGQRPLLRLSPSIPDTADGHLPYGPSLFPGDAASAAFPALHALPFRRRARGAMRGLSDAGDLGELFATKLIGQSSFVPGAANSISILLEPTVRQQWSTHSQELVPPPPLPPPLLRPILLFSSPP